MLLTIAEIAEKLNKYFDEHEEILFAIIFGSTAKGTANKISDVDIAVMISPNFNESFPFGYQAELIKHNIIPLEFAENIRGMIGFRNLLVHNSEVDSKIVYSVLQNRLYDFERFIGYIQSFFNW